MTDGTAAVARLHLVAVHGYTPGYVDGLTFAGADYAHWLDHQVLLDPHIVVPDELPSGGSPAECPDH